MQIQGLCTELGKLLDDLMSTAKSSSMQTRLKLMRAYAWNAEIDWMLDDPKHRETCDKLCDKVIALTEPLSRDPKGAYPYYFALVKKARLHDNDSASGPIIGKMTEIKFEASRDPKILVGVWDGAKLFDIPDSMATIEFRNYQNNHNYLASMLESSANSQKYLANRKEEVQNHLATMPTFDEITRVIKGDDVNAKLRMLSEVVPMIDTFVTLRKFKQARHLMAVAMYHLVKIRQNLEPKERSGLNHLQASLSGRFAHYGIAIVQGTHSKIEQHHNFKPTQNDAFVELTGLIEDGLEIYESQFPIEYADSFSGAKKILKRARSWNNRALELSVDIEKAKNPFVALAESIDSVMRVVSLGEKQDSAI